MRVKFIVALAGVACVLLTSAPNLGAQVGAKAGAPQKAVAAAGITGPDHAAVVSLADQYIADLEKKLSVEDREMMKSVKGRFRSIELQPAKIEETINALVSVFTIELAGMKSANGLTVASAFLVKLDPNNPRVTNLFGAVLHSTNRLRDAVTVLELTAAQSPDGVLARLNLANAYFDRGLDAKAKVLIDQALKKEPDNQQAWRTMATYWFRRKNFSEQQKALLRGAQFEGFVAQQEQKADKPVDANEILETDDLSVMEKKAAVLAQSVPLSTADLIEDLDPPLAHVIRERAGKLLPDERMKLPLFPQVNTSSTRGYTTGGPVIAAWVKTFVERYGNALEADMTAKTGITRTDDTVAAKAKAMKYANAEIAKTMGNAQDILKFLKNADMPGMSKGQINSAMAELDKEAKQLNVKIVAKPVDPDRPPGFDYGSPFAKANYRNYLVISRSLESQMRKYFTHFDIAKAAVQEDYFRKVAVEQKMHADIDADIERRSAGQVSDQKAILQEQARYARAMNKLGDEHFKSWVNLYVQQYTKQMKPMLETYWATCILYVRNMHDLEVSSREYSRVRGLYMLNMMKVGTYAADGGAYVFVAATDEELDALDAEIKKIERDEVPKQSAVFNKDFKVHTLPPYDKPHEKDWVDFIGENLNYELKLQFISVKLTAQSIELNFWAFGPAAGIKMDFVDEKMETYVGMKAKWDFGIKIGAADLSATAEGEFSKMTSSWDFLNGKYSEGFPPPTAKLNVGAKAGNFSLSGDLKYDAVKGASASAGAKGGFGSLEATGEIGYSQAKGYAAKSGASLGAGPVSLSATSELDGSLTAKNTFSAGVSAQGVSVQRDLSIGKP